MAKPIRLLQGGLTSRYYAVTAYKEYPDGLIEVTGAKHDVTADVEAIVGREVARLTDELELTREACSAALKDVQGRATASVGTAEAEVARLTKGVRTILATKTNRAPAPLIAALHALLAPTTHEDKR